MLRYQIVMDNFDGKPRRLSYKTVGRAEQEYFFWKKRSDDRGWAGFKFTIIDKTTGKVVKEMEYHGN